MTDQDNPIQEETVKLEQGKPTLFWIVFGVMEVIYIYLWFTRGTSLIFSLPISIGSAGIVEVASKLIRKEKVRTIMWFLAGLGLVSWSPCAISLLVFLITGEG